MARGQAGQQGHWWNEPPAWAWAAIVAGVVAFVALSFVAANRPAPPKYAGSQVAAETSTPASPTTAAAPPSSIVIPADPQLLVIGDSYTEGNGATSSATTFARTAAAELSWPVETDGVGGTGFVNAGPRGDGTYAERIAELEPETDPSIVVIQGGLNDRGRPGITGSAVAVIQSAQQRWPGAAVIVLGPVTPNPPDTAAADVAAQLEAAAAEAQVPFIDARDWITEDNVDDYGRGDQIHVNQAGHDYLGERLAEAIVELAAAA